MREYMRELLQPTLVFFKRITLGFQEQVKSSLFPFFVSLSVLSAKSLLLFLGWVVLEYLIRINLFFCSSHPAMCFYICLCQGLAAFIFVLFLLTNGNWEHTFWCETHVSPPPAFTLLPQAHIYMNIVTHSSQQMTNNWVCRQYKTQFCGLAVREILIMGSHLTDRL